MSWIPIKEKMPDPKIRVLISYHNLLFNDLIQIAWLDSGMWWINSKHCLDRYLDEVTHWQPLPPVEENV